jgi:hypothetical protein
MGRREQEQDAAQKNSAKSIVRCDLAPPYSVIFPFAHVRPTTIMMHSANHFRSCKRQALSLLSLFVPALVLSIVVDGSSTEAIGQDASARLIPEGMVEVFSDDFSKGISRWETTDDESWEIVAFEGNDALALNKRVSNYQPKVRSPHNIALIRDLKAGDCEISFRVRSTQDTGNHRDCCVFFGYQDPEHFYYVHLGAKPDPASGQIMIVNGEPRRPLTKNEQPVPWDDQWHTVRLIRKIDTGTIEVYFDDLKKPLMTVSDKTFGAGRIGIGSFDDMNAFDDVRVFVPKEAAQ